MKDRLLLEDLPVDERRAFCQRVLEGLSDLVEGEAQDDLERSARRIMGDRAGFRALCETLAETIDLARECGQEGASAIDEDRFRRCVDHVRQRLREAPGRDES
jgi:hypothetical protein